MSNIDWSTRLIYLYYIIIFHANYVIKVEGTGASGYGCSQYYNYAVKEVGYTIGSNSFENTIHEEIRRVGGFTCFISAIKALEDDFAYQQSQ